MAKKFVLVISLICISVILATTPQVRRRRFGRLIKKRFERTGLLVMDTIPGATLPLKGMISKYVAVSSANKPTVIEEIMRKTNNSDVRDAMKVIESKMVAVVNGLKKLEKIVHEIDKIEDAESEKCKQLYERARDTLLSIISKFDVILDTANSVRSLVPDSVSDLFKQFIKKAQTEQREYQSALEDIKTIISVFGM